jgi:methionyl aminopeptidase
MNDDSFEKYKEAGRIAAGILSEGAAKIRIGTSYLELVDDIEARVHDEGGELAFPLNVSLNEDAAHDTASPDDPRVFAKGDLVKLDLGVHIDGYIADTATTIDLGNNGHLVQASDDALQAAIREVKPGATAGALGAAVQQAIESRGYRPIANLTGHGLDRFVLHRSPTIPNIGSPGGTVLEEGMVFAIEPFATTGSGHVGEKARREIYSQISSRPVRVPSARAVVAEIQERNGLPFARHWLADRKKDLQLPALIRAGILHVYPVLADVPGSLVSPHEHTVIVTEDGCYVTTR